MGHISQCIVSRVSHTSHCVVRVGHTSQCVVHVGHTSQCLVHVGHTSQCVVRVGHTSQCVVRVGHTRTSQSVGQCVKTATVKTALQKVKTIPRQQTLQPNNKTAARDRSCLVYTRPLTMYAESANPVGITR